VSGSTIEAPLIEALKNSPTEFAALNAPDPSGLIWAFTPHYPKKLDIPGGRAASAYPRRAQPVDATRGTRWQ
jgi:hypothetical protein